MSRYAQISAASPYPAVSRLTQLATEFLREKAAGDVFPVEGGVLVSHSGLPAMRPTAPALLTSRRPEPITLPDPAPQAT